MDYSNLREQLIDGLKKRGYIQSVKVEVAMRSVPREKFVFPGNERRAYLDQPLDIGNGQTISAPHMVAIMTEALDLSSGHNVLEIGTGSGYHAAVVASIIGKKGTVYSVERFEGLANRARQRLKDAGVNNVRIVVGDGSEGLFKFASYDRIYVTCSSPDVPQPLKDQVKIGGKIVIPVGHISGELLVLNKKKDGFETVSKGGCAFVPLVGKYGFEG
jgi:protein-L-isoaspartate(D-aspartate) O-methyltransferase